MIDFINYGGEIVAVIRAEPNWRVPPKLRPLLPFTDIATAISHRETRRTFARTTRHTFDYSPIRFATPEAATSFRLGLERLKDETVAVPLWTDEMRFASGVDAGDNVLPLALSQAAARTTKELMILSYDSSVFELVTVTASDETTVTIAGAGTIYAWSTRARVLPLFFGRFSERPEFRTLPPFTSGQFRFREDSKYARKITPVAGPAIRTVGPGIPAFSTTTLWDIAPDWVQVLDTTEVDVIYRTIGFGREDQSYAYQQSVRRGFEMQFTCNSRAAIAKIERLFMNQRGIVESFFMPTWRKDLVLAQNLPIGGAPDTIVIEESRFTSADFTENPGTAFIAMIDSDGSVFAKRISEIDEDGVTLHLTTDITNPHPKDTTRLCPLVLVRFAEPELAWEYLTPSYAKVRIKFIEQPDEYATPQPASDERAELFRFYLRYPAGVVELGQYTSYENTLTFAAQTYATAPYSRGPMKQSLRLDQETLELTSWGGDFAGNPLGLFMPFNLDTDLWLDVINVNVDDPDDATDRILFSGTVWDVKADGPNWSANCVAFGRFFERKFPRFLVQKTDNYVPYTRPTGLVLDDWDSTSTITVLAADHIDVATLTNPSDYFSAGWFGTGAGANRERRSILKSTLLGGGGQRLYLNRPLLHAVVGQAIALYPGYDGSLEQCDSRFDNLENFGGHKYVPDTGPQIKAIEAEQVSGGKKG